MGSEGGTEVALACLERALAQVSSLLQKTIDIFSIPLPRRTKQRTWLDSQITCPKRHVVATGSCVAWPLFIFKWTNNRSFINRNLELQCGRREIECNQESQGRIKRRARTKRGLNIIDETVYLSAAQMNPDTDFSTEENLIDISFLAVTACVSDLRRGSRMISVTAACDVRMTVVSNYPG